MGHVDNPIVGRTPWSAADAPVGLLAPYKKRDEGVPRGPGGPPHKVCAREKGVAWLT